MEVIEGEVMVVEGMIVAATRRAEVDTVEDIEAVQGDTGRIDGKTGGRKIRLVSCFSLAVGSSFILIDMAIQSSSSGLSMFVSSHRWSLSQGSYNEAFLLIILRTPHVLVIYGQEAVPVVIPLLRASPAVSW